MVDAVSTGVRDAQSGVPGSVHGVGTDVTVTQTAERGAGGGPGHSDFR